MSDATDTTTGEQCSKITPEQRMTIMFGDAYMVDGLCSIATGIFRSRVVSYAEDWVRMAKATTGCQPEIHTSMDTHNGTRLYTVEAVADVSDCSDSEKRGLAKRANAFDSAIVGLQKWLYDVHGGCNPY